MSDLHWVDDLPEIDALAGLLEPLVKGPCPVTMDRAVWERLQANARHKAKRVLDAGYRKDESTADTPTPEHCCTVCCSLYICPTSKEWECPTHGGFDVCCDHPDCPGGSSSTDRLTTRTPGGLTEDLASRSSRTEP